MPHTLCGARQRRAQRMLLCNVTSRINHLEDLDQDKDLRVLQIHNVLRWHTRRELAQDRRAVVRRVVAHPQFELVLPPGASSGVSARAAATIAAPLTRNWRPGASTAALSKKARAVRAHSAFMSASCALHVPADGTSRCVYLSRRRRISATARRGRRVRDVVDARTARQHAPRMGDACALDGLDVRHDERDGVDGRLARNEYDYRRARGGRRR
jgi:hypothetical protein